ncbi:D-cysteine desulfhydrase [alpha proteobacterium BAL199]|nr:D-cysteine desulfhydrase [alpha proteobacterium BAL199]
MEALEQFLRTEAEPLQYAAFFGSLVILGFLELAISRSRAAPCRGRRWSINFGLTALNILILGAIPVSGVFVADYARDHGYGLLNVLSVSALLALPIGILVRSLLSWAIHLAMHKIPLFWRVHRLHHTDPVLDISTTVRFHPLEFLIATPVLLLAILAVGISPTALMAYEIFDAVMAVFSHANIRVPSSIERILRLVLVTPDVHRIHHSSRQAETDSNYGATLTIWDRLFGTYREKAPRALATMTLGLEECQDDRVNSIWWLLTLPVRTTRLINRQSFETQPDGAG